VTPFEQVLEAALRDTPASPDAACFEAAVRAFEVQMAEALHSAPIIGEAAELVLGQGQSRSMDELRRWFRRMALLTHPDRPGGSHEAFLRAQALYDEAKEALAHAASRVRPPLRAVSASSTYV
jgi:hypothetical protein